MKVAIFKSVGQPLLVMEFKIPEPADDEVLLKVSACGICGSDLHMTTDPETFGIASGFVLGHEFAGEVVQCGNEVKNLQAGDRVAVAPMRGCGHCDSCRNGDPAWCPEMRLIGGGYAEFATVAARQCRAIPSDLLISEAALAEPVAVGLHVVMRSGLKPGDSVLVLGAGPIGLLVAFWARRMGARHVIVSDINKYQERRAAAIGATGFAISGPELSSDFKQQTGVSPDIVFECVGKRGLIEFACQLVRVHGTVMGVGLCVGGDSWDPFGALSKELKIIFAAFFSMAEFETAIEVLRSGGNYRPQALISNSVTFGDLPETFEALRQRTTQCKVFISTDAGHGNGKG
jgi:2-desacetyl-2-hydroxyethyl bacteriochlorophyllide A dehydrogenase